MLIIIQIERRLAPFWRGLNDHSDSWTEAQLVAAARGLPIPAPDEIPPEMSRTASQASSIQKASTPNLDSSTLPISSRSQSHESVQSGTPSPSRLAFSSSVPLSGASPSSSTAQLLRGRAKTLASLATGSKSHSPDITPQEIHLPKDPYVNGQPVEAYLYKDASECPICFMYYPPYLNKTRCCDQPICSECFVQIKRPDPHPPEHEQPGQQRPPEEEAELLVSEVAACPFCVTPEFGITYEPPPFRRGLAYAKQLNGSPFANPTSAMSSTTSLNATGRRRTISISANAPQVITTDRVRPDWAKKLADARAHVLRRSAAATALHNAAYVLGSPENAQMRNALAGFRRRRTLESHGVGERITPGGVLLSPYAHPTRIGSTDGEEGGNDMYAARGSSRRSRVDALEDLMMMEAIRQSLAAEDERKRREEKDAKKDAKKKAKEDKKEAKQASKLRKKSGASSMPLYQAETNDSSSSGASMSRENSTMGGIPEEEQQVEGKGKAPVLDFAGFNPLTEPTSTLNTEMRETDHPSPLSDDSKKDIVAQDAQRHLEESRANLQPTARHTIPDPRDSRPASHLRQTSETHSFSSSLGDQQPSPGSGPSSLRAESSFPLPIASSSGPDPSSTAPQPDPTTTTPPLEPMPNFRSLTAMMEDESNKASSFQKPENTSSSPLRPPPPTLSSSDGGSSFGADDRNDSANRSRGDSGNSSSSSVSPAGAGVHEVGGGGGVGEGKGVEVLERMQEA